MTHCRYKKKYRIKTVHTVRPTELPVTGRLTCKEVGSFSNPPKLDQGQHYRFSATFPVSESDFIKGSLTVQLDPFKIAEIYNMTDFALMMILKKTLCAGNRGHKNLETDLRDIICAAERRLELLEETKLIGETL